MNKKFGFAVVGCGSIAEVAHFPSLKKAPEAELIACVDIDEGRARGAAEKWGAKYWFLDYKEMLSKCRELLDAVILATPPNGHRNQASICARAGLHMLIEKPIAITNKEAWEIVEAGKKNKVKVMVGCDRRFWTQNKWAKQLIEQGVIGNVLMARTSLHETWHLYLDNVAKTDFRLHAEETGGAALPDTGAHAIDLLTWLIGTKAKKVVGIAKRLAKPATYTLNDDTVWILIEFDNGSYGCVSCNRFSPTASQVTELYGTEGTIYTTTDAIHPFQSVPMAVYTDKDFNIEDLPEIIENYRWPEQFWAEDIWNRPVRKRWISICPPRHPSNYENLIRHFIDCIIKDEEPLTSAEDGARATEVMMAVIKSMRTDAWVELPLKEEIVPDYYKPLPRED
ncbi:MAG: Gfo/Idh/MocA family oxidoreductase [Actinobacteria bacterium]|nr:Gfo/Idh/MocA family oxidoreductase [Actinomycetota bacterium]